MNITLQSLQIVRFKGLRDLTIPFQHITNIYGKNEAGKTSVLDAWLWLMTGKDSTDRKDFEIKPLVGGKSVPKVDVEVIGHLLINNEAVEIKRILREKWQKKKGEEVPTLTGNEQLFFWNDVPLQAQEFSKKINAIVDEEVFKMLTNLTYFNGKQWQTKREMLLTIAGGVTDNEVLAVNPEFSNLLADMKGKKIEEYKKQLSARRKKIKDELDLIPSRIDEVNRSMKEERNWQEIRTLIADLEKQLAELDQELADATKSNEVANMERLGKQDKLHKFKTEYNQIARDAGADIDVNIGNTSKSILVVKAQIDKNAVEKTENLKSILTAQTTIKTIEARMAKLKENWHARNKTKFEFDQVFAFDEHLKVCPTCKQHLEQSVIDEKAGEMEKAFNDNREKLETEFNTEKKESLKKINDAGVAEKVKKEKLEKDIIAWEERNYAIDLENETSTKELNELKDRLSSLNTNRGLEVTKILNADLWYLQLKANIDDLETELNAPQDGSKLPDVFKKRKADLMAAIKSNHLALADQVHNENQTKRKKELETQESDLAQQLASAERDEFLMQNFSKTQDNLLGKKVNGLFKFVTFKLFDTTIDGNEFPACIVMVPGRYGPVPYSDVNNAARINGGIDIINTLSDHYGVKAPIFVDNRESVNNLIESECQIVNLFVTETDNQLRW